MPKSLDLTGQRFDRLRVVRLGPHWRKPNGFTVRRWECICDCGKSSLVATYRLRGGKTKSCGCYNIECVVKRSTIHGFARRGLLAPGYETWQNMKQRCLNPAHPYYSDYGGRGITVYPKWVDSFEEFLQDMGPPPPEKPSLDRIDNNKGYYPGNCRWADAKTQTNNTRRNLMVDTAQGKMTLALACELYKISYGKVYQRIRNNVPK